MSALYLVRYQGHVNVMQGSAVLYIGRNLVVGIDAGNNRYEGTYAEDSGCLHLQGSITATTDGGALVTGVTLNRGQELPILADLPTDFDNGEMHRVLVDGNAVWARFEKIADIP